MSRGRVVFRVANGLWAAAFVLFAAVQWNDPDPAAWVAIYLAAALPCALEAMDRLRWPVPAVVAIAALAWAAVLAPRVVGQVDWAHAFAAYDMSGDIKEEEARELTGLAIVAAWCSLLAVIGRRIQAQH